MNRSLVIIPYIKRFLFKTHLIIKRSLVKIKEVKTSQVKTSQVKRSQVRTSQVQIILVKRSDQISKDPLSKDQSIVHMSKDQLSPCLVFPTPKLAFVSQRPFLSKLTTSLQMAMHWLEYIFPSCPQMRLYTKGH